MPGKCTSHTLFYMLLKAFKTFDMMRLNFLGTPIHRATGKCLRSPRTLIWPMVNTPTRTFVTTTRLHTDKKLSGQQADRPNAKIYPSQGSQVNGNPELPKFSLDGLDLGKNMKIFLVVVLCIFGTMETWFYCKAIWQ